MSDAEAKEEKKAPAVKGRKGKKDVIFIGDVYRNLFSTDEDGNPEITNPLIETIDQLLEVHGDKFNIYVQSRYKLDQRKMPKAVAKAIVEVFEGDIPHALRAMHEEHEKMFDNCQIFMTVDAGIKEGGKEWFDKFCEGIKLHAIKIEEEKKFDIPGLDA